MCSSLTMNTDSNDNNEHENALVGHMCGCVICQVVQEPGKKNFTEYTSASLASKLQKSLIEL